MFETRIILFIFICLAHTVQAERNHFPEIDSNFAFKYKKDSANVILLRQEYQQANNTKQRLKTLRKGVIVLRQNNLWIKFADSLKSEVLDPQIQVSGYLKNYYLAEAYFYKGYWYKKTSNFEQANFYFQKSNEYYLKIGDKKSFAWNLLKQSECQLSMGRFDIAQEMWHRSEQMAKEGDFYNKDYQRGSIVLLLMIYKTREMHAKIYFLVDSMESEIDKKDYLYVELIAHKLMAVNTFGDQNYVDSLINQYLRKEDNGSFLYSSLLTAYYRVKTYYYTEKNDIDSVIWCQKEMLKLYDKHTIHINRSVPTRNLIFAYLQRGDYDSAKALLPEDDNTYIRPYLYSFEKERPIGRRIQDMLAAYKQTKGISVYTKRIILARLKELVAEADDFELYHKIENIDDSLSNVYQKTNLREAISYYNKLNSKKIRKELEAEKLKRNQQFIVIGGSILVLALIALVWAIRNWYRRRVERLDFQRVLSDQKLLLSQLNPHFISNAMNAIQYLFLNGEIEKSNKYIHKFSSMMRTIIVQSREEFISIQKEINLIENYLDLQSLRYLDSLEFKVEQKGFFNTAEEKIPTMIVQPFVENAIEHGLPSEVGKIGKVLVQFERINNTIEIHIRDNGPGMKESTKPALKDSGKSVSVKIIRERIDYLNKRKAHNIQLEFLDGSGEYSGLWVKIVIGVG